jgi:2-polyprenyl-3-methyl-5-hydroxy-6-metoxy-1,4-benzoquinol methylase
MSKAAKTKDILDYGCGKSTLAQNLPFNISQYDPAVELYSGRPEAADIIVCTDVLEHIEPELIDNVLDDIKNLMKVGGFIVVSTRAAKKVLKDGRNAHLIQEDVKWWFLRMETRFTITNLSDMGGELVFVVEPRRNKSA